MRILGVLVFALRLHAAPGEGLGGFLSEEKDIWASPLRVERKHAPWLILFGAGTAALVAADARISRGLSDSPGQLRWGTRLSRTGSSYGVLALSAGLYGAGAVGHDARLKRTGLASAEALGHSLVVTYGLKWLAARERPGTGSGRGHFWSGYDGALKGEKSFPSGHSMESWAVASVIAHEYSDKPYVPWLAYGFASMVSASRVAAQRHYVGDVTVGAAAGLLIGRFVHHRAASATANPGKHGWLRPQVRPEFHPAKRSAMLSLTWVH